MQVHDTAWMFPSNSDTSSHFSYSYAQIPRNNQIIRIQCTDTICIFRKYGENIHVQLTKTSGQILVIIDDDGPGIEKKEYENVFRPFYKINKGRGDSKSSVGLGMSIASDIVRSHGGNIILDNSPLKGLRVKIFLPF